MLLVLIVIKLANINLYLLKSKAETPLQLSQEINALDSTPSPSPAGDCNAEAAAGGQRQGCVLPTLQAELKAFSAFCAAVGEAVLDRP